MAWRVCNSLIANRAIGSTGGQAGTFIDNVVIEDNNGTSLFSDSFDDALNYNVVGGGLGYRGIRNGFAEANSDWQEFRPNYSIDVSNGFYYTHEITWGSNTDNNRNIKHHKVSTGIAPTSDPRERDTVTSRKDRNL